MNKHKIPVIKFLVFSFFLIAFCDVNSYNNNKLSDEEKAEAISIIKINKTFLLDKEILVSSIIDGNNTTVGFISIRNDDTQGILTVRYDITEPGWTIIETEISLSDKPYIRSDVTDYYETNPDLNRIQHNPGVLSYECELPLKTDKIHHIVADAVIERCQPDWSAFNDLLPAGNSTAFFEKSDYSYYSVDLDIDNNGVPDDFDYEGWSISLNPGSQLKGSQMVRLLSSYHPDLDELKNDEIGPLFNIPACIKTVNWILNQNFISGPPHPEFGIYTPHDVQAVILKLFNERINACRQYDKKRVNYIFTEALKYHDYEPGCGENAAVILLPVDSKGNWNGVQPVLISYTVPCLCGD